MRSRKKYYNHFELIVTILKNYLLNQITIISYTIKYDKIK